jgi:hypothetical protein
MRFAVAVAMMLATTLMTMSGRHYAADAADAALTVETFRSPAVSLKSGQIANTPSDFGPLDWVKGAAVIRHFASRLVDGTGRHVPLTEVYVSILMRWSHAVFVRVFVVTRRRARLRFHDRL